MTILVLAETDQNGLTSGTRSTLACAREIGGEIDVLICGADCEAVAAEAADIPGIRRVYVADAPHLATVIAENVAPVVEGLAGGYSHVLAAASSQGKGILPRVAARLGVQPISEISAVIDPQTFIRPIYAGNAMATVRSSEPTQVITVRTTSFEPVMETGGSATVEAIDAGPDSGLVRFIAAKLTGGEGPDLTTAKVVVSGGRGVGSAENFQLVERVAARLGAAVGASRAAVDAGYIPNDHQVGQSGKIVAPDVYIAVGISGAIQHWAGMKDAKVIAAINNDPEAPIFQMADYGLVADLMEALGEIDEALSQNNVAIPDSA
ncbi:MAG: FAD-binding protein [Spiribacter sp.]|nr:FAD-binding protein [Spiribacter sp.]